MEKILIIDDSRISQALVAEIFADTYVLEFRNDGPSGLAAARELSPDLILLDIHMPMMDGFEVCRSLKSDEKTREIPVIFITSLDSEMEKVKGFEAGAEDYVVKPFHMEELEARVRAHLASRRAKAQALELERLTVFRADGVCRRGRQVAARAGRVQALGRRPATGPAGRRAAGKRGGRRVCRYGVIARNWPTTADMSS